MPNKFLLLSFALALCLTVLMYALLRLDAADQAFVHKQKDINTIDFTIDLIK